jgi:HlyD family secretion protein
LDVEIAVDLLSTDAVHVKPGDTALVDGWGGSNNLKARVKRIEPAAFTKVSALGIEEQRVKTILEIIDPPSQWVGLGHQYRVFVRITIWQSDNALHVPLSALFRHDGKWAVFRVDGGVAKVKEVTIGRITSDDVQILNGLSEGETVIVHPSELVTDGVRVENRENAKS